MKGRDYIDILSDEEFVCWVRAMAVRNATKSEMLAFLKAEEPCGRGEFKKISPKEDEESSRMQRLKEKWGQYSIGELEPTVRAYNLLYSAGIKTVGQLIGLRKYDIQRLRNCGKYTADEIAMKLERLTGYAMRP